MQHELAVEFFESALDHKLVSQVDDGQVVVNRLIKKRFIQRIDVKGFKQQHGACFEVDWNDLSCSIRRNLQFLDQLYKFLIGILAPFQAVGNLFEVIESLH